MNSMGKYSIKTNQKSQDKSTINSDDGGHRFKQINSSREVTFNLINKNFFIYNLKIIISNQDRKFISQ